MHILDLPLEIIQKILDHLDSRHLYESAFVCKRWNAPALQRWYNYNLCLDNMAYKTAMGLLKQDSEERNKYFQYAHLVKQLEFHISISNNENTGILWEPYMEDFVLFLEYFPNLLILNICNVNFASKCYECIFSSPPIRALQNIQHIGPVVHFKHRTYPSHNHFKACYLYRTTITKITTTYIKNVLDGRDTFDMLKDFTQLSELEILNGYSDEMGINDIFAIFPKLKIFDSYICEDMPEESIKIFLKNKPNRNNMNTSLIALKLHMTSSISANYLRYITDYISLQLQSVDLKLDRTDFNSWLNEVGVDIALRFAKRLSKMNRFQLSWPASDESSEVIQDMGRSKLKNFFKFVQALETDKNTFFRSNLIHYSSTYYFCYAMDMIEAKTEYFENWIEYNSKTGYNLQYKLESSDFNCFKTKSTNEHVQDIDLSMDIDGLEKLNFINVNLINVDFVDDNFNQDGLFEVLQLVLINCPNLEFYQHTTLSDESVEFNDMIIGADLTHFGTDQQVEYYHQRSTETKENLRSVKFDKILPSQELLDLMSTHLPNIETIAVLGTDPNYVRLNKSVIDLTSFKELDSVYFDLEKLPDSPGHYFVALQYVDDDEYYYYYQSSECCTSFKLIENSFVRLCLDSDVFTRIVTIKCKKDIKVTIGSPDVGVIAEIVDGCQLSHISDDSHKNYKLLSDGFKQLK